jgi:DNA polymerase III sliding clamp (beta) subunit (PCNA family)|tara:strand:- start:979 stop:1419 length:441 start_codon:yes stop_codon:yes gene_type:complete
MDEKAFFSNCSVLMSNKELKKFSYQEEKHKIPDLELDCSIFVDLKPFLEFVKFVNKIDEKIGFEVDNNNLRLSINDLDYRLVGNGEGEAIKTSFNVEYLYSVLTSFSAKELKEFDKIGFSFNSRGDYPIKINLGDNWVIIAPRVEV